jgi:hypothetical protein
VDVTEFEKLINACQGSWTWPEKITAEKALKHLRGGKKGALVNGTPSPDREKCKISN